MKKVLFLFSIFSLILFSCNDDNNDEIHTWLIKQATAVQTDSESIVNEHLPSYFEKIEKLTEKQVIEILSAKSNLPENAELIKDEINIKGDIKYRRIIYKEKVVSNPAYKNLVNIGGF